jgi:uncharacterized tellurite resistance protein B-like protein
VAEGDERPQLPRQTSARKDLLLESLVAMAAADGRVGARERKLLSAVAERWGLGEAVLDELVIKSSRGPARLFVPEDEELQHELLDLLIDVAVADREVAPRERTLLHRYCAHLGMTTAAIDALLESAQRRQQVTRQQSPARPSSQRVRPPSHPPSECGRVQPSARPAPVPPAGPPPEAPTPVGRLISGPPMLGHDGAAIGISGARVVIHGVDRPLNVPRVCACCLGEPEHVRELRAHDQRQTGNLMTITRVGVSVGYCGPCLAHQTRATNRELMTWATFAVACGLGAWLALRGFSSFSAALESGFPLAAFGAALVAGAWIAAAAACRLLLPTPKLVGVHATEGPAATLWTTSSVVALTFARADLAASVAALNGGRLESRPASFAPWDRFGAGVVPAFRRLSAAQGAQASLLAASAILALAGLVCPTGDAAALSSALGADGVAPLERFLTDYPRSPLRWRAEGAMRVRVLHEALAGPDVVTVLRTYLEVDRAMPDDAARVAQRLMADAQVLRNTGNPTVRVLIDETVRRLPPGGVALEHLVLLAAVQLDAGLAQFSRSMDFAGPRRAAVGEALSRDDAALAAVRSLIERSDPSSSSSALLQLFADVPVARALPGAEEAVWRSLREPRDFDRLSAVFRETTPQQTAERLGADPALWRLTIHAIQRLPVEASTPERLAPLAVAALRQGTKPFLLAMATIRERHTAHLPAVRARLGSDSRAMTLAEGRVADLATGTVPTTDDRPPRTPLDLTFELITQVPGLEARPGIEQTVWSRVRSEADLDRYLALYPSGQFRDQAERKRIEFRFAADVNPGTLPPSRASGRSPIAGRSVYSIQNDTTYELTVSFLGPDAREISVPPGGKRSVDLVNGEYRIRAATASSTGVKPYHARERLVDGTYEGTLVIRSLFDVPMPRGR